MPQATFRSAQKTPFFLVLAKAEISDKLRGSVLRTVAHIFTIYDEENDTKPPSLKSFKKMMAFMKAHPEIPAPALHLSDEGVFTVVYDQDVDGGRARFSATFHKNGKVHTSNIVRKGDDFVEHESHDEIKLSAIRVPERLRASPTP